MHPNDDDSWPPVPTKTDWVKRILVGLCLTLATTAFMTPPGRLGLGIALSALLAGLICALMELLARVPPERQGRVIHIREKR